MNPYSNHLSHSSHPSTALGAVPTHDDHDDFGDLSDPGCGEQRVEQDRDLANRAAQGAYASSGYTGSSSNLFQVSLATDNVFSDGSALELATVTGSAASGFTASLTHAI